MIYFIKSESGHVKIGYTKNGVTIRLKNLQCGNPYPLSVMRVIKGHTGLESALHTRFGDLRCVGEWFVLTDELKNFIETFQEPLDIEIREETDSEKDIKA